MQKYWSDEKSPWIISEKINIKKAIGIGILSKQYFHAVNLEVAAKFFEIFTKTRFLHISVHSVNHRSDLIYCCLNINFLSFSDQDSYQESEVLNVTEQAANDISRRHI